MSGNNGKPKKELNVAAECFFPQAQQSPGPARPPNENYARPHSHMFPPGGNISDGRRPNPPMDRGGMSGPSYGNHANYSGPMNAPHPMAYPAWTPNQPRMTPYPMNSRMPMEASRGYQQGPPTQQRPAGASRGQKMPQGPRSTGGTPAPPSPAAAVGPAAPVNVHAPPPPPPPGCKKVIMVIGYCGSGRTTVAKAIASSRGYEYVNLKGVSEDAKDDADGDAKEAVNEVEVTNERLAVLDTLLATRKETLTGIVLDDVVVRSRFEAYYVNHILQRYQLGINAVVFLAPLLSTLLARDPALYRSPQKMSLHPECFELASRLEDAAGDSGIIAVVDNEGPVEEVLANVEAELKAIEARPTVDVQFPPVQLMDDSALVTDPELVERILNAETEVLKLDGAFGFPFVQPNYLLDYPAFVRSAIQFKSYMVVPWVWGDKVSIIGFEGGVYVHLPSFRLVFKLGGNLLSTPMVELMKKLQSEVEAVPDGTSPQPITFSLEASLLDGVLYISDMMLMGRTFGSKTLLPDRVKLLHSELGKFPRAGNIRVLEHFPVHEITKCLESCDKARGVLFVNPDGMMCGQYDSRNYLYPLDAIKTVRLRVWNGRTDGARWQFDAYSLNDEEEVIVNANDEKTPIVISDEDVDTYAINDGHIIECVLTVDSTASPPPPKGARRAASKQVQSFAFVKRCRWESKPITLHYQSQFSSPRSWTTAKLAGACSTISYEAARVPVTD